MWELAVARCLHGAAELVNGECVFEAGTATLVGTLEDKSRGEQVLRDFAYGFPKPYSVTRVELAYVGGPPR